MKRAPWLLALLLLGGCVYYNGMYNTKRLAGVARKAEREGRTFEASNAWGQVSVKAESLLAQHPRSKYAEEARLLHGIARAKLNDCGGAMPSLEAVMLSSRRAEFAEEAAEMVGSCRVILGDPSSAAEVYGRLTGSRNLTRRNLALFAHGQALRLNGQYDAAFEELRQTEHPRARGERAAALAGAGKVEEALAVIDTLLAVRDTAAPWSDITAELAQRDLPTASVLTDRLVDSIGLSLARRSRLIIDDGLRLSQQDEVRSEARLVQATRLAGSNAPTAIEARLLLIRRRIARFESSDSLRQVSGELNGLSEMAGSFTSAIMRLASLTRLAAVAADSAPPGAPQGDLRLFLAAELGRDSIGAPRFAGAQFRRVVRDWPQSPFAPKALLALILLEPGHADSLQQQLRTGYPASPYLSLVDGSEAPQLGPLEDSLSRFTLGFRDPTAPGVVPAAPGARPNRPTSVEPQ